MTFKKVLTFSIIGFFITAIVFGSVFYFTVHKKPKATIKEIKTYSYSIGEMFSNVKDSRKILKANIILEISDEKLTEKLDSSKPKITNSILELLRSKDENSLLTEKSQSLLRKEILQEIQKIVNSEKIIDVYFIEFIIQ